MVSLGVLLTLGLLWPWPRALAADPQTVTQTLTNGDVYVGETVNGKRQGEGVYTSKDGKRYTGAWQDDKRHGQGTLTFPNGDKYVGEFVDGLFQGQGTYPQQRPAVYWDVARRQAAREGDVDLPER